MNGGNLVITVVATYLMDKAPNYDQPHGVLSTFVLSTPYPNNYNRNPNPNPNLTLTLTLNPILTLPS